MNKLNDISKEKTKLVFNMMVSIKRSIEHNNEYRKKNISTCLNSLKDIERFISNIEKITGWDLTNKV